MPKTLTIATEVGTKVAKSSVFKKFLDKLGYFGKLFSTFKFAPKVFCTIWFINIVRTFWNIVGPFLTKVNEATGFAKIWVFGDLLLPIIQKLIGGDADVLFGVNKFTDAFVSNTKLAWSDYLSTWMSIIAGLVVIFYLVIGKRVPFIGLDISASNWIKRATHPQDRNKSNFDYAFGGAILFFSMYMVATKLRIADVSYWPFSGVYSLIKTIITNHQVFIP